MSRRKPFTHSDIYERERWPEIQAGRRGPEAYETLGIVNPRQRRELIRLARVDPEGEKSFLDEVTCLIIGYRLRKLCHTQENPAAVAESTRQFIDAWAQLAEMTRNLPYRVVKEVCDALGSRLPAEGGFVRANEQLQRLERRFVGHRPGRPTERLIIHAWDLQRTGACSTYLALDWRAMQQWVEVALEASGEPPTKGHGRAAFLKQLMLPCASNGTVDLDGRPAALGTVKSDP